MICLQLQSFIIIIITCLILGYLLHWAIVKDKENSK